MPMNIQLKKEIVLSQILDFGNNYRNMMNSLKRMILFMEHIKNQRKFEQNYYN